MKGLFVTGTNTNIGKTVVSALLSYGMSRWQSTGYWKPVQSGAREDSDTETIRQIVQDQVVYGKPVYNLQDPLSPDQAAAREGVEISMDELVEASQSLPDSFWFVEGAGGLLVPLNSQNTMEDLMESLDLPNIVVASTELGTLNHSLLTWKRLALKGQTPLAMIFVGDPNSELIDSLKPHIPEECMVFVPRFDKISQESFDQELKCNSSLAALLDRCGQGPVYENVSQGDRECVWHPFTQHGWGEDFPTVSSGRGAYLKMADGKTVLDGISSWWVNIHGHGHPVVAEAIAQQAHQLEHTIFAGYTHAPAVHLVKKLVAALQSRGTQLSHGFFSDNGSTAVEVALKMAYQFHQNNGEQKRTRYLALNGSYHGDTLGAMSVAMRGSFHRPFTPLLFDCDFVDPDDFETLDQLMAEHGSNYAAVIVEPLLQGAGGMVVYSPEFLNAIAQHSERYGFLTIADEILTGFYRTGTLFAFEQSQWKPDILCMSKGLTAGFLPMSLTMATTEIFSAFQGDEMSQAFLHGHSYTANPIACRAALVSFDLLESSEIQNQIQQIMEWTQQRVHQLAGRPNVFNARSLGTMGAFDLVKDASYFDTETSRRWKREFLDRGLLLRPLGSTIYTLPPYCVKPEELNYMYDMIEEILTIEERPS